MLHIFQDAFYLLMLPSSRVCDGLQEAPLNKTALICTTDTPWKLRKLQQKDLGVGARARLERGGRRLTQISVSVTTQTCQRPSSPSGAQDGTRSPIWKSGEAGAHSQGSLVLRLFPQPLRTQDWSPLLFPQGGRWGKERTVELLSSNCYPTSPAVHLTSLAWEGYGKSRHKWDISMQKDTSLASPSCLKEGQPAT